MKANLGIFLAVPIVQCLPFEQFQTSGFSNFDTDTGTFTSGSNTNLYQETRSSNVDDFLLSFEKFPSSSSGGSNVFNPFASADGSCDEFCQNVFALDAQSQAQFEQDFLSFQSQFGNSLNNGVAVEDSPSANVPKAQPPRTQPQPPRPQTQVSVAQLPDNNVNNAKPDENFKSNNNVQNKNFLFFGDNKKSNNREPQRPSTPKTIRQSVTKPTKTTTPFTVFTTPKPRETSSSTKIVAAKTTKSPSPVTTPRSETTSKKSTKIKWTFNCKTIGTSTITSKPPTENKESDAEKLPISSYFNEDEEDVDRSSRKDRKINVDSKKDISDFPVFDAVPN